MKNIFISENTIREVIVKFYHSSEEMETKVSEMIEAAQRVCDKIKHKYTREIEMAIILHDIGMHDPENHHIVGSKLALDYLREINSIYDFRKTEVISILSSIKKHRSGFRPDSLNPFFEDQAQIVNLVARKIIRNNLLSSKTRSAEHVMSDIIKNEIKYNYRKYKNILDQTLMIDHIHRLLVKKYGSAGIYYTNPLINQIFNKPLRNLFSTPKFSIELDELIIKFLTKEMRVCK